MKVSDPLIFGHAVRATLPGVFSTYGEVLAEAGLRAEDGLASILAGLEGLTQGEEIRAAIETELAAGPRLSMVDSDRGITNLHVPSDVIIDASMPAMIRAGGHLWGRTDGPRTRSPSSRTPPTPGSIRPSSRTAAPTGPWTRPPWAQCPTWASWPTRPRSTAATTRPSSSRPTAPWRRRGRGSGRRAGRGAVVPRGGHRRHLAGLHHSGRPHPRLGAPGSHAARATGAPAVFWLDPERGHDAVLIDLVNRYLADEDTEGLDIRVLDPVAATRLSLERARRGEDTIVGDRQRAARLQHGPLPHPRAGHERQDALGGTADERRRPL